MAEDELNGCKYISPKFSGSKSFSTKISPSSSSNSSFCRICHEGDGIENLVSVCKCTGTVALIHASCLETWLTSSNTDKCEICKHQFPTTRSPRTYAEYIQDTSNQFNVRNLIADIICFFLLTPLLVVSTYLCALGAKQYYGKEKWEAAGLIVLGFFLLSVYYTWCHVTLKFHVSVWRAWKETNQRVRLAQIVISEERVRMTEVPSGDIETPENNESVPLVI